MFDYEWLQSDEVQDNEDDVTLLQEASPMTKPPQLHSMRTTSMQIKAQLAAAAAFSAVTGFLGDAMGEEDNLDLNFVEEKNLRFSMHPVASQRDGFTGGLVKASVAMPTIPPASQSPSETASPRAQSPIDVGDMVVQMEARRIEEDKGQGVEFDPNRSRPRASTQSSLASNASSEFQDAAEELPSSRPAVRPGLSGYGTFNQPEFEPPSQDALLTDAMVRMMGRY